MKTEYLKYRDSPVDGYIYFMLAIEAEIFNFWKVNEKQKVVRQP